MTVVVSTDSENVILMLGCVPDPASKGSVLDSVGATVSKFVMLSLLTVELSMDEFVIVELSIIEFIIVELSIIEFEIVELSMVELSTVDETMLEHCLTVELSMDELSVIDELSETVEELSNCGIIKRVSAA